MWPPKWILLIYPRNLRLIYRLYTLITFCIEYGNYFLMVSVIVLVIWTFKTCEPFNDIYRILIQLRWANFIIFIVSQIVNVSFQVLTLHFSKISSTKSSTVRFYVIEFTVWWDTNRLRRNRVSNRRYIRVHILIWWYARPVLGIYLGTKANPLRYKIH